MATRYTGQLPKQGVRSNVMTAESEAVVEAAGAAVGAAFGAHPARANMRVRR
jgi:hypothetical protein